MLRNLLFLPILAALVATASEAGAQYHHGYRGGVVEMTPFGPMANFGTSPDYMLFVRNPAAYEQVMMQREQKMMAMQQKQMIQYQQAYMKEMQTEQKAYQDWAKKNPEQAAALEKRWVEMNTPKPRKSKSHKSKSSLSKNGLPKPKDCRRQGQGRAGDARIVAGEVQEARRREGGRVQGQGGRLEEGRRQGASPRATTPKRPDPGRAATNPPIVRAAVCVARMRRVGTRPTGVGLTPRRA